MYVPFYQCFIYNRMLICGQFLLLRAIAQHHVDFLKENWSKKKMGEFSLAEASVNWKFVTVALVSLDYFYHHEIFVHMCADRNFFLSKPTMHEIYSIRLKF